MTRVITYTVGQKSSGPSLFRRLSVGIVARLVGRRVFSIPNQAMLSTLRVHDVVQLDESAYRSSPVMRGDVVVYRSVKHEGILLPSRVVGLPGETVELRNGTLHINGLEVPEPYVDSDAAEQPHSKNLSTVDVPSGQVFLMGDFRDMSEDSRFVGPVPLDLVVGRIFLKGRREV